MNRFAPSTTGRAHPGTLLAALLCWLDARSRGAEVALRMEDLDPQRCTPALATAMGEDLAWFGLDWDQVSVQSSHQARYHAALDRLADAGLLYACTCSRSRIKALARPAADGGFAYDNACRDAAVSDWRQVAGAVRMRLDGAISIRDEDGTDLGQDVAVAMGDPVLRRRDGAVAYHLASVVDDAASGVTRVVRGRDLAASTAIQVAVQRALGLRTPVYRHHLLVLERRGTKLAKFHGAVGADVLCEHYGSAQLCGILAHLSGLRDSAAACHPHDLIADFSWDRVRVRDQVLDWTGSDLVWGGDE
ncbi:MAG: glutamate--tRNA ligase family protein [Planctomycetota bacterium]|jgi:glutamyl-Q tRNA(Asp) synthetase|nr:glutamate--tRNA ligase family protein [Planctomycetota bacterium]